MSGKAEQEPSIEEILASIRQIISDDEEEPAAAAPAPPPPAPPPPAPKKAAPPPPPPPAPEEDVLELTDPMDEEPKPRFEIDMKESEPESEVEEGGGDILTDHAAGAALEGFMRLAGNMAVDRKPMGNVTLEDIVRELMRPMLREWLDVHLPPIIEKVVQKELDKIARKAVDE